MPATPSRLPLWNYGPDFDERGIMSIFPPEAVPGKEYPIQVPQVDADGNDLGGVRYPDMQAPIATYIGWALRKAGFAEGELMMTNGCIKAFTRTKAEREKIGDPRLSIEERYPNHQATSTSSNAPSMNWSRKVSCCRKTASTTSKPPSGKIRSIPR